MSAESTFVSFSLFTHFFRRFEVFKKQLKEKEVKEIQPGAETEGSQHLKGTDTPEKELSDLKKKLEQKDQELEQKAQSFKLALCKMTEMWQQEKTLREESEKRHKSDLESLQKEIEQNVTKEMLTRKKLEFVLEKADMVECPLCEEIFLREEIQAHVDSSHQM